MLGNEGKGIVCSYKFLVPKRKKGIKKRGEKGNCRHFVHEIMRQKARYTRLFFGQQFSTAALVAAITNTTTRKLFTSARILIA